MTILTLSLSFGQTAVKKSNISTSGGSVTIGTMAMVYTVGEIAVQENTVGTIHLSEGFIAPDLLSALGVEQYTVLEGVNVYPNPVKNNLNITLPEKDDYELYLYDLNGKQIINTSVAEDSQLVLDLSMQKTGLYLLVIINRKNKTTTTLKIQKQ